MVHGVAVFSSEMTVGLAVQNLVLERLHPAARRCVILQAHWETMKGNVQDSCNGYEDDDDDDDDDDDIDDW